MMRQFQHKYIGKSDWSTKGVLCGFGHALKGFYPACPSEDLPRIVEISVWCASLSSLKRFANKVHADHYEQMLRIDGFELRRTRKPGSLEWDRWIESKWSVGKGK